MFKMKTDEEMTETAKESNDNTPAATAKSQKEQMSIVIVGHVDHGKSTLVGRIFHDTDSLPEGKYEQIKSQCEKRGMPFEWSFLMDALQAERDQGITIDTTQIWFKTKQRDYVIIDAPGHKEFLKNMVSGAANSEAALLVIDAKEGVQEQSKRHGYLLHLLGVSQIAVVVNKMDLVDYSQERFDEIEKEYRAYLQEIGVDPMVFIPVSGREGDCIIDKSHNMPWYEGPSIIQALDQFQKLPAATDIALRLPVQDVYKFDDRRIIAGRIESGSLKAGDEIIISPSNKRVEVASIEQWPANKGKKIKEVSAGMSVGITLKEQIFVERGNVISHEEAAPYLTNILRVRLFWMGDNPIEVGKQYLLKINTSEYKVEVKEIEQVVDTDNLAHGEAKSVPRNAVAEVVLRSNAIISLDPFQDNAKTGRLVLLEDYRVVGGGIIDMEGFANLRQERKVKSTNIHQIDSLISRERRSYLNGHLGGVLWFTGLSGSGKTTLSMELQKLLFAKGYQVYVLDGDNIRSGLNSDLGFSPEDRTENIRRIGEVASLFADAGFIVITAFVAPYKEDRDQARLAAPDCFHSIYIKSDLKTCEKRDPKGLYKKARAGEILDFTGVQAPYEEPENPDLVVDTQHQSVDESVGALLEYVQEHFVEPVKTPDYLANAI